MTEFRKFLDAQKVEFNEHDLMQDNEWIRANIKAEIFTSEFGQQEGQRVRAESDPQVLKALDLIPKAKELADNAHRIIAERNQARNVTTR
jgi:carboxyl-terminal processing protease